MYKPKKGYYIVNEASAAPILDGTDRSGMPADHSRLCTFESNTSSGFRTVVAAIRRYSKAAPPLIRARCATLEEGRRRKALEILNTLEGDEPMDEELDDGDVIAANLFLAERRQRQQQELADITAATQEGQGMHMDEDQAEI